MFLSVRSRDYGIYARCGIMDNYTSLTFNPIKDNHRGQLLFYIILTVKHTSEMEKVFILF